MTARFLPLSIFLAATIALAGCSRSIEPPQPAGAQCDSECPKQDKALELVRALTHAKSPDPEEKIKGLLMLPLCAPKERDEDVVTELSAAFRDPNPKVRLAACKCAGALLQAAPDYRQAAHFSIVFGDSNKDVREAAYFEFSRGIPQGLYGQDEIWMLNRAIKEEEDPASRDWAYWVLGLIGERRSIPRASDLVTIVGTSVISRLDTESTDLYSPKVARNLLYRAVHTLGRIGWRTPQAGPALIKLYARFPTDSKLDREMRGGDPRGFSRDRSVLPQGPVLPRRADAKRKTADRGTNLGGLDYRSFWSSCCGPCA